MKWTPFVVLTVAYVSVVRDHLVTADYLRIPGYEHPTWLYSVDKNEQGWGAHNILHRHKHSRILKHIFFITHAHQHADTHSNTHARMHGNDYFKVVFIITNKTSCGEGNFVDSPEVQVIIFASPTKVKVWVAVDFLQLFPRHGWYSSEITLVW